MTSALLSHTILAAHDPASGRYDALRLAGSLGLSTEEMARAVGRTPRGLRKTPDSPRLQEALAELVALVGRLRELLDGSIEYVRVWLRAPHPDLGGRTPLSYLVEGKPEVVTALVEAIEAGQPG
jgi:hypothetical protein